MESAQAIRLAIFIGVMVACMALEAWLPARVRVLPRARRWATNLSLSVLGAGVGVVMAPILAISVAVWADANGLGLLALTPLPLWVEITVCVILLDFAVWAQHVASHRWDWLWRLHSVHHADRDLDASSGVRFHPLEIAVSLLWKAVVITALGAPVLAVLIFEIILNAGAIITHTNVSLPPRIDRMVRRLFVTPDMHRIHHSVELDESRTNYGFNLSIWDRVFGVYSERARGTLTLGLIEQQSDAPAQLLPSLALPFARRER